jgi:hypothetical protein
MFITAFFFYLIVAIVARMIRSYANHQWYIFQIDDQYEKYFGPEVGSRNRI